MRSFLASSALAAITFAGARVAQSHVYVVDAAMGPGSSFATIQAGIDAAQPRDVLLVRTGTYPGFALHKGLTIAADQGAQVVLSAPSTVSDVPATESVLLSGLTTGSSFPLGLQAAALDISNCPGPVLVEHSTLQGIPSFFGVGVHGVRVSNCGALGLTDCLLRGSQAGMQNGSTFTPGSGLALSGSTAWVHGCQILGGKGATSSVFLPPGPGGSGLTIDSGFLSVMGSAITGGNGGDKTFFFGCAQVDGGAGLVLGAGAPLVELGDTTLAGGAPTPVAPPCIPGDAGASTVIASGSIDTLGVSKRTLSVASPLREGQTVDIVLSGKPGDLGWWFLSAEQSPLQLPFAAGVLVPTPPSLVFFFGVVPASGELHHPLVLGELGPGIEALVLYEQAAFYAPAEGLVLSNGLGVLHLDAAVP